MSSNRWERVEQVFLGALELEGDERQAYLDEACGDDAGLRAEIEEMLGAESQPFMMDKFLDQSSSGLEDEAPLQPPDGGQVGPYRIVSLLGRGGMGAVWLAEQSRRVQREVAIKVLHAGLDSREFEARFRSEKRALERLEHPNIAGVYDAGTTSDGRPWIAMERVLGPSVVDYADAEKSTVRERLGLFLDICEAVQYAHQRGIIHRDLKPSNVLVSTAGARPVPKVIDFGIAKAIGEAAGDDEAVTRTGMIVGTPAYMSPELVTEPERGADTRTDVYALGVLLYKLLVGVLPIDDYGPMAGSWTAAWAKGLPRPSVRLAKLGDTQVTLAQERGTTLSALRRELVGELDWIVLRALETDPDRRYASVERLSDDVERYLRDEPVLARPPSRAYRAAKFARRHRLGITAAAVATVALVAGSALATVGMVRARTAEAAAVADAEEARRIRDFLVEIFDANDPGATRGEVVTARELLDRGANRIRLELTDQPLAQADLMSAIGYAYHSLGLNTDADTLLAEVVEIRSARLSPDDPDRIGGWLDLADVRLSQARFDDARALSDSALTTLDQEMVDGGSRADSLLWGRALRTASTVAWRADALEEGREYGERAVALLEQIDETDPRDHAASLRSLAFVSSRLGDTEESLQYSLAAYETVREGLGNDHPATMNILDAYALQLTNADMTDSAMVIHQAVLADRERVFGPDASVVAYSYHNIGRLLSTYMGQNAEAVPYLERSIEIRENTLSPNDPTTGFSIESLAIAYAQQRQLDTATPLFRRAVDIFEAGLGPSHSETLEAMFNLANLSWIVDGPEAALTDLTRAVDAIPEVFDDVGFFYGRIQGQPFDQMAGDSRYEELVARVREIAERSGVS